MLTHNIRNKWLKLVDDTPTSQALQGNTLVYLDLIDRRESEKA